MKPATQFLSVLALALLVSAVFAPSARAEDTPGYPRQFSIESRMIVPSHHIGSCVTKMEVAKIDVVISFQNGSDKLTPAQMMDVKKVAAIIKSPSFTGSHVMVNGFTDNVGKDAANQRLSYHRALRVMHALVANGVPAGMLSAQGFGKDNPVATNATAEGRAMNRRVTFTVLTPES